MTGTPPPGARDPQEVLADAVRVLTEAARLRRPVLERDEAASATGGHPVWTPGARTEPADWAEFVTLALAGAAANVGGIDVALAGRPGSWEADGVRNLLTSTVGYDEEQLLEHRTDPVTVHLHVDELLLQLGVWEQYDEAFLELDSRVGALSDLDGADADAHSEICRLEDQLEQQRQADWHSYGEALRAAVQAAAERPGLRVPVVVDIDLNPVRSGTAVSDVYGLEERLAEQAFNRTPAPGDGRRPLERLTSPQSAPTVAPTAEQVQP